MLDKITKINLLFDFYGELLTEKQKEYFKLYYEEDLSYGEISENFNVSRNAVFKQLKNCEENLENYESKLKLVEKYMRLNNIKKKLIDNGLDDIALELDDIF